MEPIHNQNFYTEKQIYARIQKFYDLLDERRHSNQRGISIEDAIIDLEIDHLMSEYSKIFDDIVYVS